jgi:Zn-dependent membrane protease YugP
MLFDPLYWLFILPPMLLGMWAQRRVTNAFRHWSAVRSATGITGAEAARRILDRNGLGDVPVNHVAGQLSDHYDRKTRSVNLSDGVYAGNSVAAVCIAAHECGHAIQHQRSYVPMTARAAIFPAAAIGSSLWGPLIMVGVLFGLFAHQPQFFFYTVLAAVSLFSFAVLFHLVTLPVEFDASHRARGELNALGVGVGPDAQGTSAVLNAAAMTYVAGALASLAQLAYWVMVLAGGGGNRR